MTARDRRVVLLGLLVVLAAFGLRLLPVAVERLQRDRDDLRAATRLLASGNDALGAVDQLEADAEVVRRRLVELAPALVGSGGRAGLNEATAALSGQVGLVAGRHRARVLRTGIPADTLVAPSERRLHGAASVRLAVTLESDLAGLLETIAALEKGEPTIAVRGIRLQAADAGATAQGPQAIVAEVTLEGRYLRSGR